MTKQPMSTTRKDTTATTTPTMGRVRVGEPDSVVTDTSAGRNLVGEAFSIDDPIPNKHYGHYTVPNEFVHVHQAHS